MISVPAKLQVARRERERVIAEQRDSKPSISESGYDRPSCPMQVWGDKMGRKKGGRMVTFEEPPEDCKRKKTAYTPLAHLPEKVRNHSVNICIVQAHGCSWSVSFPDHPQGSLG